VYLKKLRRMVITIKKSLQLIFCIALLHQGMLYAQEKPQHERKVYVAPDGKTYWNKNLPLYIRVSPSKDEDAANYLMKSESTPNYADPFFLDTEGINYLRSRWAVNPETKTSVYPQVEVLWEIYRDGTPPVTSLQCDEKKYTDSKGTIYGSTAMKVILSAKDAISGVENILYSLNKAPFDFYKGPFVLTEEKEHEIQYYAVDNVGNAEEIKVQKIVIDNTPPRSKHVFIGETKDNTVSSRVTLELFSEDNLAGLDGIYFKINDQPEKKYQKPVPLAQLSEGEHVVSYYAIDQLGHKEDEQIVILYVDNTPPIITADLMGDNFIINSKEYSSTRTRVRLNAIDNKAGVKNIYYSINGEDYQEYESPFFLNGAQGNIKISYYAIDNVGNKSSSATGKENITLSYLDLTGPELSYNFIGPSFITRDTAFISSKTQIELKGVDHESGLRNMGYSVNNKEQQNYIRSFSFKEEGVYKIGFYGWDNVQNSSQSNFVVVVDNEGPEIYPTLSISPIGKKPVEGMMIDVFSEHVVLFLAASDKIVGYEYLAYSINNEREIEYVTPVQGFKRGHNYLVYVTAKDKLGNKKTGELKFTIED
jgi:hypothetical protein